MSFPTLVAMFNPTAAAQNRPTASTWSGTAGYGSHSNDAYAYDVEATPTTAGYLSATAKPRASPGVSDSTIIYHTFGSGTFSGTLYIYIDTLTSTGTSSDTTNEVFSYVVVEYASDWNGTTGTWNYITTVSGGVADLTYSSPLTVALSGVNRANLAVRVSSYGVGFGTTIQSYARASSEASIYDVIIG